MKKLFILGLMLLVSTFTLTAIAAQPPMPADGMKMELTKKPVTFNHSAHVKDADDCTTSCHHMINGVEQYIACGSAGCHDALGARDKSVNSYYQIAHKAKDNKYSTCMACHVASAGADADLKKQLTGCAKSVCHS